MGLGFQLHVRIRPLERSVTRYFDLRSKCTAHRKFLLVFRRARPALSTRPSALNAGRPAAGRKQFSQNAAVTTDAETSAVAASSSPLSISHNAARQGGSARACGAPTHSRTIPAAHEIVVWKVRNCARHLLARHMPLARARPQPCLAKRDHGKADRTHLIPTLHASRRLPERSRHLPE